MSKKASVYRRELEIRDPLVERIAEVGGRDFEVDSENCKDKLGQRQSQTPISSTFWVKNILGQKNLDKNQF